MREQYQTPDGRAWRLAATCPKCDAPLRLRRRRADGGEFLGCSTFPACSHAEDADPYLDALADRIADLESDLAAARRHRCASPPTSVDVARELRNLVYRWHPDRHPEPIPPHDVVSELTALRARVAA